MPGSFVLRMCGVGCTRRLRAHARGGVPPLRRRGALRTEPPLRMSTCAAVGWLLVLAGTGRGLDKDGFALTLAGECPLCGAERLEDGAPAPRECLRRE